MDFGYILRRAAQISRRHWLLWLFGLLASLGGLSRLRFDLRPLGGWLPEETQLSVGEWLSGPYVGWLVAAAVLLLTLLGLAVLGLNALGRAALTVQVNEIENGGTPTLRTGWRAGVDHAGRVLALVALLELPAFVVTLSGFVAYLLRAFVFYLPVGVAVDPLVRMEAAGRFFACLMPATCLGLLLGVPLRLVQRLAVRASVLERHSLLDSLRRAWELLRNHSGWLALLWSLLTAITVLVVLPVIGSLALLAWGAVLLLRLLTSANLSLTPGDLYLATLLSSLVATLVNGAAETFFSAAWTVAYREMTGLGRTGE